MPNPGQDVDERLIRLFGLDQGTHDAAKGETTVEDAQHLARAGLLVLATQLDQELALGAEEDGWSLFCRGELRLPEVQPSSDRQEVGGFAQVGQQGPQDDPVVCSDGAGAVGAAGAVLVKGAGAPDVFAVAVDLGV